MWKYGDHIVAGISGGADSICLLLLLLELRERWNLHLTAVHVQHGLRGAEADADELFVRELCRKNDVEFRAFHVDAAREAVRRRISEEEAGRDLRREIFEQVREETKADVIALAHHENDNVETFLFRLCRGSGLEGLCGIRPVNGKIVHPLLCVNRREIEAYLQNRGQGYCTDHTNFENDYSRNRIRNRLIPFLEEELNRESVSHISGTIYQFWEIQEYLSAELAKIEKDCVVTKGDMLCIAEKDFKKVPNLFQKMLLKNCLIRVSGHQRDIGSVHVEALMKLMDQQCGRERHLPYRVLATRTYGGITLSRRNAAAKTRTDDRICDIRVPCDRGWIRARVFPWKENMQILEKTYTKWFDYDIIKYSLQIRTREPGDYLITDRSGSRQKLKAYFINEKIPKEERDKMLLLADGSHILWVIGHRMSMAGRITESTKRVLEVQITEEM